MNDENRKAMFAKYKTHRIKNMPSLENNHYLITPKSVDEARVLRLAQRDSARVSDNRNKAYLRQLDYNKFTDEKYYSFFEMPEYKKLGEKRDAIFKSGKTLAEIQPVLDEIDKEQDILISQNAKDQRQASRNRKKSALSFSGLHRSADKKYNDIEDLVNQNEKYQSYGNDQFYEYKSKKDKIKGFDKTQVPNYTSDMYFKMCGKEKLITEPIRDEIAKQSKISDELMRDEKKMFLDYDDPKRIEVRQKAKVQREKILKLYDELTNQNQRFENVHDSVYGHIPKFKR